MRVERGQGHLLDVVAADLRCRVTPGRGATGGRNGPCRGLLLARGCRANSAVSTSVSDVAAGSRCPGPASVSSSRVSSSMLIRLPLCPSARPPLGVERKVGWAFSHTDEPEVE